VRPRIPVEESHVSAVGFVLEHWSSRETSQLLLKFGLLLLPIALAWWRPGSGRRPERLVRAFGLATGVLALVIAWIQLLRGDYTASLNAWEDRRFAIEIAGYQLGFVLVGVVCALQRRTEELKGVTLALLLCVAGAGLANLLGWGAGAPRVAELGVQALGLGVALVVSAALARVAWLRAQIAVVALAFAGFALVHLHAWLALGELSMGNVGPSLWHDLALPAVSAWVLTRR